MKRIIVTAVLFGLAVAAGELTFGNRAFPLNVWYFEKIAAWKWSLPVHLAGFLWLLACERVLKNRPAPAPIALAFLFFLAGETANWYVLKLFEYAGDGPVEKALSFWIVMAMYAGLCAGAILMLRAPDRQEG
ncbi:MAG: hypothetical protein AB1724_15835 [Thermodesulfobacteriota bacterium]